MWNLSIAVSRSKQGFVKIGRGEILAHVKRVAKCLATPTFVDYMLSLTHLSRSTLEFITLTNVMTCSTNVMMSLFYNILGGKAHPCPH